MLMKAPCNTPNTFGWYVAGKMFDWYLENGGVVEMEKQSIAKTAMLYIQSINQIFM